MGFSEKLMGFSEKEDDSEHPPIHLSSFCVFLFVWWFYLGQPKGQTSVLVPKNNSHDGCLSSTFRKMGRFKALHLFESGGVPNRNQSLQNGPIEIVSLESYPHFCVVQGKPKDNHHFGNRLKTAPPSSVGFPLNFHRLWSTSLRMMLGFPANLQAGQVATLECPQRPTKSGFPSLTREKWVFSVSFGFFQSTHIDPPKGSPDWNSPD